jgi:hypothetical protein
MWRAPFSWKWVPSTLPSARTKKKSSGLGAGQRAARWSKVQVEDGDPLRCGQLAHSLRVAAKRGARAAVGGIARRRCDHHGDRTGGPGRIEIVVLEVRLEIGLGVRESRIGDAIDLERRGRMTVVGAELDEERLSWLEQTGILDRHVTLPRCPRHGRPVTRTSKEVSAQRQRYNDAAVIAHCTVGGEASVERNQLGRVEDVIDAHEPLRNRHAQKNGARSTHLACRRARKGVTEAPPGLTPRVAELSGDERVGVMLVGRVEIPRHHQGTVVVPGKCGEDLRLSLAPPYLPRVRRRVEPDEGDASPFNVELDDQGRADPGWTLRPSTSSSTTRGGPTQDESGREAPRTNGYLLNRPAPVTPLRGSSQRYGYAEARSRSMAAAVSGLSSWRATTSASLSLITRNVSTASRLNPSML